MNEKDFVTVLSDSEFIKTLLTLDTGEKVQAALASKGLVLTPDELDKFAEILIYELEKKSKLKLKNKEEKQVIGGVLKDSELYTSEAHKNIVFLPENSWFLKYKKSKL